MTGDPDLPALVTVPALLKVDTVARLLDCSNDTVRRRINDGSLPAVREHERTMVRADDLRAYIDELARYGPARQRRRPRRRHDLSWMTE